MSHYKAGTLEDIYVASEAFLPHLPTSNMNTPARPQQYLAPNKDIALLDNKLRSLGAATAIVLPSVAVIGKQLAGKSSLLRGLIKILTGIRIPIDCDTTTRCPLEVRMTHSLEPWRCQIYIRRARGTSRTISERSFGSRLTINDDIELMLQRARIAVLNDDDQTTRFLELTWDQVQQPGLLPTPDVISKNFICMDVSGPTVPNMTFIDLPGIIDTQDPAIAKAHEDFLLSHIQQPNVLILAVMAMNDEARDQSVIHLAKRADPQGLRTIGVLTKADTLSSTANSRTRLYWLDVLEGRKLQLKHGYCMTRLPNQEESVRAEEASRREMVFFRTQDPWRESNKLERRFGCYTLSEGIKKYLEGVLETDLPNIEKAARDGLGSCETELAALPSAPSPEYLTTLIRAFSAEVCDTANGSTLNQDFASKNDTSYRQLKDDVKRTAPNFQPWVDEDEFNRLNRRTTGIVDKRWREVRDNRIDDDEDFHTIRHGAGLATQPLYLNDIRQRSELVSGGLPSEVQGSKSAQQLLVVEFVGQWHQPALECLSSVGNTLELELVLTTMPNYFEKYPAFENQMKELMHRRISACHEQARLFMDAIMGLQDDMYTQNFHLMATLRESWFHRYEEFRETVDSIAARHSVSGLNIASSSRPHLTMERYEVPVTPRRTPYQARLPPQSSPLRTPVRGRPSGFGLDAGPSSSPGGRPKESYNAEISIMAEVRAYFEISSSHFIDLIPKLIKRRFLHKVGDQLADHLMEELNKLTDNSPEVLRNLLSLDPAVESERKRIEKKQIILGEVLQVIENFNRS